MINVNGKEYSIKREIKFGEYRKINSINSKLTELSKKFGADDLSKLEDIELIKISQEFANTNEEQLKLITDFLESIVGLTQEEIDNLTLENAIKLFQEAFKESTIIKKK